MAEPETILQLGIEAAREGNREEARNLFSLLTRQEPENVQAWLWLAGVAEGPEQRRAALERVILLDPENEMAVKGLQAMGAPLPTRESERPTDVVEAVAPVAAVEPDMPVAVTAFEPAEPAAPLSDEERYAAELDAAFDDYDALPRAAAPVRAEVSAEEGAPTRLPPMPPRSSPVAPRDDDEEEEERRGPSLLMWVLVGLIAVAVLAFLLWQVMAPGQSTPPPPTQVAAGTPAPGGATTDGAAPTAPPTEPTTPIDSGAVLTPTAELTPTATLPLTPTVEQPTPAAPVTPVDQAQPAPVAVGTNLEADGWTFTYPNQNYAVVLGPRVSSFTAQGTFVHVLMFVANNSGTNQALPGDFFVLKDAQGRVYQARPDVSSAAVQRGVNADIGHEDQVPANGLTTSVYLVFDVTPGATNLVLFARNKTDQGFQVIGVVP